MGSLHKVSDSVMTSTELMQSGRVDDTELAIMKNKLVAEHYDIAKIGIDQGLFTEDQVIVLGRTEGTGENWTVVCRPPKGLDGLPVLLIFWVKDDEEDTDADPKKVVRLARYRRLLNSDG
jgi:hypothetical protein